MTLICLCTSCLQNSTAEKEECRLYRILVGDKFGFMDASGKIVIEPKYESAETHFSENLCWVKLRGKRYLIDTQESIIKELPDSLYVAPFVGGLAGIGTSKSHYNGIMNTKGDIIVPPNNLYVGIDRNNGDGTYVVVAEKHDVWYITNEFGQMIGTRCDSILVGFSNGLCAIKKNEKWGYIDTTGKLVIDTIYDYARNFADEGLARVIKGTQHMFINKNGKCVIEVDSTLTGFEHNRAAVIIDGEKYLIDKYGNRICKIDCDNIDYFDDNCLATITKDGKVSKIDTLGNVVLCTNYDFVSSFYDRVAFARNENGWGLIDINGNEIVHPEYNNVYMFYDNDDILPVSKKIYTSWNSDDSSEVFLQYDKNKGDVKTSYRLNCYTYFDKEGNVLWQDIPQQNVELPIVNFTKERFIDYYDANISSLDPIEGIYYTTIKNYYQDRDNISSIGLNNSESTFLAIGRFEQGKNEFWAYWLDGSDSHWVNKFTKLGETNKYAITKVDKDNTYSSEGLLVLEDLNQFDFRLETGKNSSYNFFVTYDFIRDYPTVSDYELYKEAEWTGSGFAIADGYIATNYHVANAAKVIRIRGVNGDMEKSYSGHVVARDKEHDLAIIKIVDNSFEGFGQIPYCFNDASVSVGDDVFVLGYPLTSTMGNEIKLTDGIISSYTGYRGDESMYQISAPVQPGNSGGPLFNHNGNVVGVVCGKHKDAENANYAIKVSHLYKLIESSGYKLKLPENGKLRGEKLSSQYKKIQGFVYLIECSSK